MVLLWILAKVEPASQCRIVTYVLIRIIGFNFIAANRLLRDWDVPFRLATAPVRDVVEVVHEQFRIFQHCKANVGWVISFDGRLLKCNCRNV